MRRRTLAILLVGLIASVSGCSSAPAAVLPTTTPAPPPIIPTTTATFLPPPTVTPFPTATPRGPGQPPGMIVTATAELATSVALTTPAPTIQNTPTPPPPTPTPTQALDLPQGVSVGDLIFSADFYQGWPSTNDPTAKIAISNGQYVFEIGPFDARFITTTAVNRRDVYAQVEVTPQQCTGKSGYGLLFRYVDSSNYYLFTVFCDKSFTAISKNSGSVYGMTNGTIPDSLDPTAQTPHRLGVMAGGDDLTLYFDGQAVGSFHDTAHQQGDVGVYAVSQDAGVVRVAFDNLKVWTLH